MEPLISCENLVKIYKVVDLEVVALQGLDLTVRPGELLAIVGASGSGKSTLLNILGGLDRPSAGRVTANGRNLLKLSNRELDRYRRFEVGFVWQQTGRNLIPYLTARENVELPMTVAGMGLREKRGWSQELLEMVDLWEHRRHRLAQLSGGQQQRVAIALALANKPTLLLGDEPTGEVDTATAKDILAIFERMNAEYGLTTIIVTHDPQIARVADRVVTIRDGRTSSEAVRRVAEVEAVLAQRVGVQGIEQDVDPENDSMILEELIVVDSAGRLQIPPEMREKSGIGRRVTLETTEEGVLIRPAAGQSEGESPAIQPLEVEPPPKTTRASAHRSVRQGVRSGVRRWFGREEE
ncbi:MAG TPA: ATP-binding cassette domain-containing protein [Anaerolineae bacterium]|jgi:ABC-type lipoprotein export system ATPase subunit/bifunctional DNA-binding transcriptional regulator/antitoxin component of YhaV-PrlF toxin-antitoxin module|nr:ATP-binding cassette domain-containing protein [Anaerolineae bacterium]